MSAPVNPLDQPVLSINPAEIVEALPSHPRQLDTLAAIVADVLRQKFPTAWRRWLAMIAGPVTLVAVADEVGPQLRAYCKALADPPAQVEADERAGQRVAAALAHQLILRVDMRAVLWPYALLNEDHWNPQLEADQRQRLSEQFGWIWTD